MEIKLEFKVERSLGSPLIRIMLDDTTSSFEGPCEDQIEFDIPITKGNHELRITHYGKQNHDHEYDQNGKILKDKHVEILKISLDGVELKQELWDGEFFPVYNPDYVKTMKEKNIKVPYSIKPNLYLGHNGTWVYNFKYPVVPWLIKTRGYKDRMIVDPDMTSVDEELQAAKKYFESAPEIKW